ncbi:lipid-binding protein [Prevotella sp. lc2012]|uniref:lipid-binding protein n=1 Tax=Prevotella sp. lc2012 TaxID=1761886 RepID=UPI000896FFF8|nr:lipid-binding protein [Prevotella sp. lc2012]SEE50497.1 Lipid-binding putative hydrolase [Prevotella sp. lc2012]
MRKYISFAFMAIAISFGFVSCDTETDEEPGGTNVEKMAGRWNVVVDAVDENGNVLYGDPYGLGTITIMTYNTSDNAVDKMWLDDNGKFWAFKMKVDVNYLARTFSADERDYDVKGSGTAVVTDGKVLEGAAKNLHGMPNDSIVFDIVFNDDPNGLKYRISGQRYTGFYE